MKLTVRVPATTANMGCGFDCIGMAVAIYNEITVTSEVGPTIEISGEGMNCLPMDGTNLVYRTMVDFFRTMGLDTPRFSLQMHNEVPLTGGLGSSSAALVGGLLAADALVGNPVTRDEILRLACELEGHPDNVAPALLGGMVVAVLENGQPVAVQVPISPQLRAVVFTPRFSMPTEQARSLLPQTISRADAVHNIGRAALLVASLLDGRLDLLRTATQDRLHQPYRQTLFPEMYSLFDAALEAGALAAYLSGAGSALLALTLQTDTEAVARAFELKAAALGVSGHSRIVDICREGARVEVYEYLET